MKKLRYNKTFKDGLLGIIIGLLLFGTVFVDQWLHSEKHAPALVGIGVSALCLLLFGSEHFLIPAMLLIALILCVYREDRSNG